MFNRDGGMFNKKDEATRRDAKPVNLTPGLNTPPTPAKTPEPYRPEVTPTVDAAPAPLTATAAPSSGAPAATNTFTSVRASCAGATAANFF